MANKFSYGFAPKANRDFENILEYIEKELRNTKAAIDFAEQVFNIIDSITSFPECGRAVDNEYIIDQNLRWILVNNYKMYYKIDYENEKIIIVRLVYSKMNMDAVLRDLSEL